MGVGGRHKTGTVGEAQGRAAMAVGERGAWFAMAREQGRPPVPRTESTTDLLGRCSMMR